MGTARDLRLASIAHADQRGRFAIYHPVNEAGEPIYVHAKVLIIDDQLLRVGSSNVNNRSMGFDTECDLAVEATTEENRAAVRAMRDDLLAEHLGVQASDVQEAVLRHHGSLLGAVKALRRSSGRSLCPLPIREVNGPQEFLARSNLADPERPKDPEGQVEHLVKRLVLRVPSSTWLALSAAGVVALLLAQRRRRQSDVV